MWLCAPSYYIQMQASLNWIGERAIYYYFHLHLHLHLHFHLYLHFHLQTATFFSTSKLPSLLLSNCHLLFHFQTATSFTSKLPLSFPLPNCHLQTAISKLLFQLSLPNCYFNFYFQTATFFFTFISVSHNTSFHLYLYMQFCFFQIIFSKSFRIDLLYLNIVAVPIYKCKSNKS